MPKIASSKTFQLRASDFLTEWNISFHLFFPSISREKTEMNGKLLMRIGSSDFKEQENGKKWILCQYNTPIAITFELILYQACEFFIMNFFQKKRRNMVRKGP